MIISDDGSYKVEANLTSEDTMCITVKDYDDNTESYVYITLDHLKKIYKEFIV